MNQSGAQLADVQIVVANWYRKRLGTFLRRTLNQGLGAYLVFAMSLTTAAIAGRLAWVGGMEDRGYLSTLMKTEIQPQSDATRGVVLSLLLAGLNEAPLRDELYCKGPKIGACDLGTDIWRTTQRLVDTVDESSDSNVDARALMDDVAPALAAAGVASQSGAFNRLLYRNAQDRRRLLQSAASIGVEWREDAGDACGPPDQVSKRAVTFFLAVPWCLNKPAGLTIGVISQQSADALDVSPVPESPQPDSFPGEAASAPTTEDSQRECKSCCCCAGASPCEQQDTQQLESAAPRRMDVKRLRDFRILRAQLDSEIFDIAIESMKERLTHLPADAARKKEDQAPALNPTGPSITAAFFISIDSTIRYWARNGEVTAENLPAHRHWAARPYFEKMVNDIDAKSPLMTLAYMDFAGHGVVYTECQPLTADPRHYPPRTSQTPATTDAANVLPPLKEIVPRIVVGAVCVDYAISDYGIEQLVKSVDDGPVADAELVVFGKGPAGKWSPDPLPKFSSIRSADLTEALESAANDFSTNTASRRDIRPLSLKGDDDSTFLVPLRERLDGKFDAIVLKVSGVGPLGSRHGAMLTTILAAAIALGSLLAGFRSSKAVATREQLLGRLRSLQIGVIQSDADDIITGANDRAEELVDRTLPPFGLQGKDCPRFWGVFDERTILLQMRSSLNASIANWNAADLKLVSADHIRKQRLDGRTTAYFVRLKERRKLCKPPTDPKSEDGSPDDLSASWVRITAGPILRPPKHPKRFWARKVPTETAELERFGVVAPVSRRLEAQLAEILEAKEKAKERERHG